MKRFFLTYLPWLLIILFLGHFTYTLVEDQKPKPERKVYQEKDINWLDETYQHKEIILTGINKALIENPFCYDLQSNQPLLSTSKSTWDNPVFLITCKAIDGQYRSVFFSKEDIQTNKTLRN
jgi:hypothetical protein